jgi:hypothetical protein
MTAAVASVAQHFPIVARDRSLSPRGALDSAPTESEESVFAGGSFYENHDIGYWTTQEFESRAQTPGGSGGKAPPNAGPPDSVVLVRARLHEGATADGSAKTGGAPEFTFLSKTERCARVLRRLDPDALKDNRWAPAGTPVTKVCADDWTPLALQVVGSMRAFAERVDLWAREEIEKQSLDWMKRKMRPEEVESAYTPFMSCPEESGIPRVRGRLVLEGPVHKRTRMVFLNDAGERVEGNGWDFLRENLGVHMLQNCVAVPTFKVDSFWFVRQQSCGLRVKISHVIFYAPPSICRDVLNFQTETRVLKLTAFPPPPAFRKATSGDRMEDGADEESPSHGAVETALDVGEARARGLGEADAC